MSKKKLLTPVILIIFNRPDKTEIVFSKIQKLKPEKLLIIADGARDNKKDELDKVLKTRSIVERINWPCEVLRNYAESNLGCKLRISTGLNWAFEKVERAIILEDDCVPNLTFFRFCEEMLERYSADCRIGMIGGFNPISRTKFHKDSYYFSDTTPIWGWATWRDRWLNDYDLKMTKWLEIRNSQILHEWYPKRNEYEAKKLIFESTYQGLIDTWDYQWEFAQKINKRISILPNVNLISNIGFDENSTHTKEHNSFSNITTKDLIFPLNHPKSVKINKENKIVNIILRIFRKVKNYKLKL
jgi:hypothetical protein